MADTDGLAQAEAEADQADRSMGGGLPKYAQAHALVSIAHSLAAIGRQLQQQAEPSELERNPQAVAGSYHRLADILRAQLGLPEAFSPAELVNALQELKREATMGRVREGQPPAKPAREPLTPLPLPDELGRPRQGNVITLADGGWAYAGAVSWELPRKPLNAGPVPAAEPSNMLVIDGRHWAQTHVYGPWKLSVVGRSGLLLVTAVWRADNGGQ